MRWALLALALTACGEPEPRAITVVHADGSTIEGTLDCVSGCLMPTADESPDLSAEEFRAHLEAYAAAEPTSDAIDPLLFDGEKTRALLAKHGTGPLSEAHRDLLLRELDRDTATVAFRVIDEHGVLRASLPAMEVPFGPGNHVPMIGGDALGHLLISGRVRRVGLHHLWTRW